MEELWQMERAFWLMGSEQFEAGLASQCLMALPGVGILDREQTLSSLQGVPRWANLTMHDQQIATIGDDVAVLAYEAVASRQQAASYRARCTSTYVRQGSDWRMVQHQQTPAGD